MEVIRGPDEQRIARLLSSDTPFWLDLDSPDAATLESVAALLGLHRLAIEDSREFGQRPKLDAYEDQALLVFYGAEPGSSAGLQEVHLHLGPHGILTVHRGAAGLIEPIAQRARQDNVARADRLLYVILDELTDTFFPRVDGVADRIDALMDEVAEHPGVAERQQLVAVRRELVALRRVVSPQRDVLVRTDMVLDPIPGVDGAEAGRWVRHIYDHLVRINEDIDAQRDLLAGALDIYLSSVSNRLNLVTKQLTIVATIFLPLTFVTGFFGQNFGWLVRSIDGLTAFLALGLGSLAVSGFGLWLWFRRAGFLDDR